MSSELRWTCSLAGRTIAGCRLDAVAGRGETGVVYRALQVELDRPVAFKVLRPELTQDVEYRRRFERDTRIVAGIDHPHVVPVYEAGEVDDCLYVIMQWVDGTDLRTLREFNGPIDPAAVLRLLRPVASALATAHSRGLVHADIKPANVLIGLPRGDQHHQHAYLADFAIARRSDCDAAGDIYAFGCMLLEVLTGQDPLAHSDEPSQIKAHGHEPIPGAADLVTEVPKSLDAIIAKAMATRPEDRFDGSAELACALTHAIDHVESRVVPVPNLFQGDEASLGGSEAWLEGAEAPFEGSEASNPGPAIHSTTATPPFEHAPTECHPHPRARTAAAAAGLIVVAVTVIALLLSHGAATRGARQQISAALPVRSDRAAASAQMGDQSAQETIHLSPGLRLAKTIDLGAAPESISADARGNIWVSTPGLGTVARISGGTGHTVTFYVGGHPTALAAGPLGFWVSGSAVAPLVRFDPRTGRPLAEPPVTGMPAELAVDASDGTTWSADPSGLVAHYSASGALLGRVRLGSPPIAIGGGEGWGWASTTTALVRIGARSMTTFETDRNPTGVAFDQGVWTTHAEGDVTRFDPRPQHLSVNADLPVGDGLDGIAATEASSSVWAISKHDMALYQISNSSDPRVTGTVSFSNQPVGLAVTTGSVWVAMSDGRVLQITF